MNLADMLCYADIEQLTRIAESYACECSSYSKNELIQTILSTAHRKDALESRIGEMNRDELRFLNSLLFENRTAYSIEELTARAMGEGGEAARPAFGQTASRQENERDARLTNQQQLASAPPMRQEKSLPPKKKRTPSKMELSAEPRPPTPEEAARQAIARFKRLGWLFNGTSAHTRYLLQVPDDLKMRLRDTLERKFRAPLQICEEPPVYRDEQGLLPVDLLQLLKYAQDHDMPLTSDGTLYKRQLGQVLDCLSITEAVPGKGGWRFGYGRRYRDYPDRFSLLYDYAWYNGLIREQAEWLTLTDEGRAYLGGGERPDTPQLYRFWLQLYKGPIPNLHSLVQWIGRLASDWVTVGSLHDVLAPLIRAYYYDGPREILERRTLLMMMHLGLLRWGQTEEGEAVVRMTRTGLAIVQGSCLAIEDKISIEE